MLFLSPPLLAFHQRASHQRAIPPRQFFQWISPFLQRISNVSAPCGACRFGVHASQIAGRKLEVAHVRKRASPFESGCGRASASREKKKKQSDDKARVGVTAPAKRKRSSTGMRAPPTAERETDGRTETKGMRWRRAKRARKTGARGGEQRGNERAGRRGRLGEEETNRERVPERIGGQVGGWSTTLGVGMPRRERRGMERGRAWADAYRDETRGARKGGLRTVGSGCARFRHPRVHACWCVRVIVREMMMEMVLRRIL